jgi:hypothetical protein
MEATTEWRSRRNSEPPEDATGAGIRTPLSAFACRRGTLGLSGDSGLPPLPGYRSFSPSPRTPSIPSHVSHGTITRATTGSAHHHPKMALRSRPTSRAKER